MEVVPEPLNFRSVWSDFLITCRIFSVCTVLCFIFCLIKHIHTRYKFGNLPGPKFYLFNLLGGISCIPFTEKARNGHSLQTLALQVLEGMARLHPKESLVFGWFGFQPLSMAYKPESIQAVLTDSSLIEKSFLYKFVQPVIGKGLATSAGVKWKPRRKMLNPSYRQSVVQDFVPIFNEHSIKLVSILRKLADDDIVELSTPIALCVLDIVGETIMGTKIEAQDNKNQEYVQGLRDVFTATIKRIITAWYWPEFTFRNSEFGRNFYGSLKCVHDLRNVVLQQKKKEYMCRGIDTSEECGKPLIDVLLEFHMEKKSLTEDEIKEELDTFMAASNESTSATLFFTLYLLGLDQKIQSKAQEELDRIFGEDRQRYVEKEDMAEMSYLECIIKESLRLFPTVPMIGREVPKEGKTICGYKLPPGTTIGIIPYISHRDPEIFPDPERFDPSRFFPENCANRSQYAYIPFSSGARNCIGQKFAMMEMKIVLANVLRNFTFESLDPRDKVIASPEVTLRTDAKVRFRIFPRT